MQQVAQAEVPIAKKNSYVVQLKPSANQKEISALLKKYNLTVTKLIAQLGVMTVEVQEPSGAGPAAPGATRSLAEPEAAPADPKEKLHQILEPPLIQDLRKEPIVDGAFVNSTMGAKRLPKPAGAKVTVEGNTYSWQWLPGEAHDGNWALKAIRMPPVWTILDRYRKAHPDLKRPKIGIVDGGFAENPAVPFTSMIGVRPFAFHNAGCETHHGMHVAGIMGARQGDTPGIDGMIPDARLDAIAVDDKIIGDAGVAGVDQGWEVNTLLFDDVLLKTLDYVTSNMGGDFSNPDNMRVVNISLGYNFVASNLLGDTDPNEVPGLALHILHQSNLIRHMARRVEDHVLFVVAAGNDSDGRGTPLDTRWASPFAWAGTQDSSTGESPKNIIVVEATDRDGFRAGFSNTGGHVAAPGVDIMSTLAGGRDSFGVCSGTSQAAPHVAALAAILFELDPSKKPAEIADIIKKSATPPKEGSKAAGTIDALEAALALSPVNMRYAADLDNDGKVGESDLRIFKRQLAIIESAATTNAAFTEDLNGDGVVDDNECFWPQIDINGSGRGAASMRDARAMSGRQHADIDALGLTWSDTKPYDVALTEFGLGQREGEILAATSEADSAPPTQCRRLTAATGIVTAATETATRSLVVAGAEGGPTRLAASTEAAAAEGAVSEDAKEVRAEVDKAIEELRRTNPNLRVTINPATGLPASISGLAPSPGAASLGAARGGGEMTEEETRRAVESYFGQGGVRAAFPTKNKQATRDYVGRRKGPDFPDRYIANVEQRVNGVPVFGSSAKLVVERSLGVTKFSGTTSAVAIDDTTPKVSESDATAAARLKLAEIISTAPDASRAFPLAPSPDKAEAKAELMVFDPALIGKSGKGPTRLAWMVSIDAFRIFVDAVTKEAFYYYRDQPTGMVRRVYDLGKATAFPGKMVIDEETRTREEGVSPEVLLAFRNAGLVRDFYFLVFGRDGYDDNDGSGPLGGSPLEAYVGHGSTQDAFWCIKKSYDCPKGNVMVYGPGYANAVDIVAHEMTHGVISHEKNLLYLNEPGAVNESLADIFGTLIELEGKGDGGNWLIGEGAPGFSVTAPLRSMSDPNLKDEKGRSMFNRDAKFSLSNRGQPDSYADVLTVSDPQCASTAYQDNGCVHFNSGILNKFAYLIAEGGNHRGVAVVGIGRYKLSRIAYRTMTVGLNQSSGLMDAANAFVEACYELSSAKIGNIATGDCEQVLAAQRSVGLAMAGS
jgi:Zn-dependent metalloprotease